MRDAQKVCSMWKNMYAKKKNSYLLNLFACFDVQQAPKRFLSMFKLCVQWDLSTVLVQSSNSRNMSDHRMV
jgi:hypothetical protein